MTEPAANRTPFRSIPYMGVIYVVHEAMKLGFYNGNPDWSNLGQGQPEVGEMEGAPPRLGTIELQPGDHAYGPIGGTDELRELVADLYNRQYRVGKSSQYTKANVSLASGGRLMLSRVFAAVNELNLGYMVPDYTAYEDMIGYHEYRFSPVMLAAKPENAFRIPSGDLQAAVRQHGLGAFVLSNPCNPTGAVIKGEELDAYVRIARDENCLMVFDEFYSHFTYDADGGPASGPVSAAATIDDVEKDPVILIDGLTKCYRYPGWRLGWAVGPSHLVEEIGRAASAIDGGPSQAVQRAAMTILQPERAEQETTALRSVFSRKRNLMVEALKEMKIEVNPSPEGTFYTWASVEHLPPPLNDGMSFFREALKHKVMTVPGKFFDVNPGNRRRGKSPYSQWLRFSFGPTEANVEQGLERLTKMVKGA